MVQFQVFSYVLLGKGLFGVYPFIAIKLSNSISSSIKVKTIYRKIALKMGRGKRKGRNEKRESYRSNNDDCEKFTVYLYEGERAQIEKWVKIKENIETGGDLFGLWVNNMVCATSASGILIIG